MHFASLAARLSRAAEPTESEKDTKALKLALKLDQPQPFIAVFLQERMHGPTGIFWAYLTSFSGQGDIDAFTETQTVKVALPKPKL